MRVENVAISETLAIREIETDKLAQVYPLIHQLRQHLSLEEYIAHVEAMIPNGYKVACLFENGDPVAYAGFAEQLNLYYGHHVWVYDLVTEAKKRGGGYGKILLSYIEKWAKDNALSCVALSSGLEKERAHRFYEKGMGYNKAGYVFKKSTL